MNDVAKLKHALAASRVKGITLRILPADVWKIRRLTTVCNLDYRY
ncbi:hypothetical protein L53_09270 [Hyphomonas sp. L-53-1-40]|nr:hypothetical protein [Hyphomonas sp. L-53-1-40]KCZ63450.1 hypothetical protein L53_09270 [Hyphomonas sp. L-53-1-40]